MTAVRVISAKMRAVRVMTAKMKAVWVKGAKIRAVRMKVAKINAARVKAAKIYVARVKAAKINSTRPDPTGMNETVLPHLQTLIMNNNPMGNLPGKLFMPLRKSNVTNLFLRNCSLGQFYGSPLEHLKGLEVLDLSSNMGLSPAELETLLQPLAGGYLRELYLSNSNYASVPTAALALVNESLELLDLHGSTFECLDNTSFPIMANLKRLNLMYSRINTIRYNTFQGFPALQELNLDGNGLVTVPIDAFLPSLQVLTLSENPRSVGNGWPASFNLDGVSFANMENLKNLSFDGVPLGKVKVPYFQDLHNLHFLCLSNCQISHIEPFSFRNLSTLERLYLRGNTIQILYNNTFAGLTNLKHLDLSDNSIIFQTSRDITRLIRVPLRSISVPYHESFILRGRQRNLASPIIKWTQENSHLKHRTNVFGNPHETGPLASWLASIKVGGHHNSGKENVLTPEKEVMKLEGLLRLENIYNAQLNTFLPFQGLKGLKYLDLSKNEIRNIFPELWEDLNQLNYLALGSNNIEDWSIPTFSNVTNLMVLSLTSNSLKILTEAMMLDFSKKSLLSVDLRFNEFECECYIQNFNGTLNTTHFVQWSKYYCNKDGNILTFTEYINTASCMEKPQILPTDHPDYALKIIIFCIASALFIVIMLMTVYKNRWYMRYVTYNIRMRTTRKKLDSDKYLYDIFVCYSQSDRQWVFEHLLLKLEDVGNSYRVCVHERDFTVGQEITENIINSVELSRKVMVVLTPAFAESSWCMFELQMVSNRILDERKHKLVLVLLEPIPEDKQSKKLRLLLKTRTYLAWVPEGEGQQFFWTRLLRTVAKPPPSIAPVHTTHM
nr:toll-like receptor 13 [Cherax quadricarinatus]